MNNRFSQSARTIALGYAIVGGLWILLSDQVMATLFPDLDLLTAAQTYKGWGFIATTTGLLYLLLCRVLSAYEQSQATLRESEERFRVTFEQATVGIAHVTPDGIFLRVNRRFCDILGYPCETLLGQSFTAITYPDERAASLERLQQLTSGEIDFVQAEKRYLGAQGDIIWGQHTATLVRNDHGQISYIIATLEDITKQHAAAEQLRQSEEKFSRAFHISPDSININRLEDGVYIEINEGFTRITGYTAEDVIGKSSLEIDIWANPADRKQLVAGLRAKGEVIGMEAEFRMKDGEIRIGLMSARTVTINDMLCILSITRDITERIRAERELESFAQRLVTLREIEQAILAAQSPQETAQAALQNIRQLIPCQMVNVSTFDEEKGLGLVLAIQTSEETQFGAGMEFSLTDILTFNQLKLGKPVMLEDLAERQPLSTKGIDLLAEGYRSVLVIPLVAQNDLVGALTISSATPGAELYNHLDVAAEIAGQLAIALQQARLLEQTQRYAEEMEQRVAERTRELTEANARLQELDQLKSRFVSDVSHELRTPVTNLSMYVHLLDRGNPEKRETYIEVLKTQAARLKTLVEEILDLSRLELAHSQVVFSPVDLGQIVQQVVTAHRPRAEDAGLDLTVDVADDLPPVNGEMNQLWRVITNLVANALNYTITGYVAVTVAGDDDRQTVILRVADSGIGIEPDDFPHLFDRFYRGSQVRQLDIPGTGLGLGIAREIVQLHGGTITVESTVGEGSTFEVSLPAIT